MRKILIGLIAVAAFSLMIPALTMAATLNVCKTSCTYTTIQAAIDAASAGDTVLVAAGTYTENIELHGDDPPYNNIILQGAGASVTTIQGTGSGPVVYFDFVDSSAKIDGFTITGGNDQGGIILFQSSPTISNNTITENHDTTGFGGGIYVWQPQSKPIITNNTITKNSADNGGGIVSTYGASPTITNNMIKENDATNNGGGIYASLGSPTISNNTIKDNIAGSRGGGIVVHGASPEIFNNMIWNNSATRGGGISVSSSLSPSSVTITNNTIAGNNATEYGEGIYCEGNSDMTITNSIIWGNGTDTSGDDYDITNTAGASHPIVIDYSDYGSIIGDYTLGSHNINANPNFVDATNGDFHLLPTSPCIDVGDNSAPSIPGTDFEGDSRIVNVTVDMGADEFTVFVINHVTLPGDFGYELGCSGDWQPKCAVTELNFIGGNLWRGTWDIPAGDWYYKVAINYSWGVHFGDGGLLNGPDISLSLSEPTRITFEFEWDGNIDNPPTIRHFDVLTFFEDSVNDGTLVGTGAGSSATGRKVAFRNMLETSYDLIAVGDILGACQQLLDAMNRCDGKTPPPDFVEGDAAEDLWLFINDLRMSLGCSSP